MPRVFAAGSCLAGLPAALIAALLACGPAPAAELYQWTDSKGVVHYSDTPPPKGGEAAKRLRIKAAPATPADPAGEAKPAAPAADANKPARAAQTSLPDTPENRQRLCDQARSALELLQSQSYVADAASGKLLDSNERADRTAAAQQTAASYCRNPG